MGVHAVAYAFPKVASTALDEKVDNYIITSFQE